MFPVAEPLTSGWHHGEFFHFTMLQYSLPGSGIVSRVHIFCSLQLWTWTPPLDLNVFYVVVKTFLATMQLVPSVQHENEIFSKNFQQSRYPILANRHLKEKAYCDIVELPLSG